MEAVKIIVQLTPTNGYEVLTSEWNIIEKNKFYSLSKEDAPTKYIAKDNFNKINITVDRFCYDITGIIYVFKNESSNDFTIRDIKREIIKTLENLQSNLRDLETKMNQ